MCRSVLPAVCVSSLPACGAIKVPWSYTLRATMWVLGIEARSCGRATSGLTTEPSLQPPTGSVFEGIDEKPPKKHNSSCEHSLDFRVCWARCQALYIDHLLLLPPQAAGVFKYHTDAGTHAARLKCFPEAIQMVRWSWPGTKVG